MDEDSDRLAPRMTIWRRIVEELWWRAVVLFILFWAGMGGSESHEQWADGNPVPAWVKASCCGPEDVHHLTAAQVRALPDGWHVEGYPDPIAYDHTLPSQDGDYWIFYRRWPNVGAMGTSGWQYSQVYCFFAPAQGF